MQNQRDSPRGDYVSSSDVAAALGNPGEVMRHLGMWSRHSAPMVAPVMEAIAQRAPEKFLENVGSLTGALSDNDIKAWLQLAIHSLVNRGQYGSILQYARVPQKYFGNGATAVIMSIAARNLPIGDVFDAKVLKEMKGWGFMDSEVCLVLQGAVSAAAGGDWSRQRILVDSILGAGASDRVFCTPGPAAFAVVPVKTGRQVVGDIEAMVVQNPKGALDGIVMNSDLIETQDVVRLLRRLPSQVPLEDIFDSRLLKVLQDKKVSDLEVLAILGDAIDAVSADNPLPLKDILFFSPAWTPFLSARAVAEVVKLLKIKVPQEVVWFKEYLGSSLTDHDRREVFGGDDDDSHLERAYSNGDGVYPISKRVVASTAKALAAMGEVGSKLAARLRALGNDTTPASKDKKRIVEGRINAVVGAEHSHVGGMGISIQWDNDRRVVQRGVVHEMIAGNIFGPPQTVHALADAVAYAVVDGNAADRAEAKMRLNGLATEGLRLSQTALWQMTQAERDKLKDERDYASCGWRE